MISDFMKGLSIAKGVVDLAKGLKELSANTDNLELRETAVELHSQTIDLKEIVNEMRELILEKEKEIKELKAEIDKLNSGESCPICGEGRLKITSSEPHPSFAFAGVQERQLTCTNEKCNHKEQRLHDPNGRI